ncbi:MAG TPA: OmpH family outer membrane protein [Moraxellaceae bacterium]|nr:OmpH family outer membrane protein [Moraxellaceae bacterium]
MRHSVVFAGIVAALLASPVMAGGVALVDSAQVLAGSDAAKKAAEKYDAATKVQRERMDKLKEEIQGLQAKYQKDNAIMTPKDKQDLQKQAEDKAGEFQRLGQAVGEAKQRTEQELQGSLVPKVRAIIEELRKANKYDLVIEKQGVMAFDPAIDLTKKVIEKLNAQGASAPAAGK